MARVEANIPAIRAFMEKHQWSERELAARMGVTYPYLNRVLNGQRQPGSKFIAGALRIGMRWEEAFYVSERSSE